MKSKTLILMLLLLIPIVCGTVTYTLNAPKTFYESASSTVVFNWTPVLTVDTTTTSYLWITTSDNESNFVINQTVSCDNSTSIRSTPANITGTTTETWNTLTNYTLNITFTNNTVTENCIVSLTQSATLNITEAMSNIVAVCNLTATASSGAIELSTHTGDGSDENITFNSDGANATAVLGFVTGTTYKGLDPVFCNTTVSGFSNGFYQWKVTTLDDQYNATLVSSNSADYNTSLNDTLSISYTHNRVAESCTINFTRTGTLNISTAISEIGSACNLSITDSSNKLSITTVGIGSDEYINVTGGNASGIFGFDRGDIQYGTAINYTSDSRWFEIRDSTNRSYFRWGNDTDTVMWLHRDTGDLNITGDLLVGENLEVTGNASIGSGTRTVRFQDNSTYFIINTTNEVFFTHNVTLGFGTRLSSNSSGCLILESGDTGGGRGKTAICPT